MKRLAALVVGLLVLGTVPAAEPVAAAPDPVFRFEGSGWGHGVGLSQYGARAMAESGWTASQIVTYYYADTSVEPLTSVLDPETFVLTDPDPLWIGLHQNQTSLRFGVENGSAGLCKAGDGEGECPTQSALPGEAWEFRALGNGACQFFREGAAVGNPGTCSASITWTDQPTTRIAFLDTGRTYARGTLRIRPNGADSFHVMLEVGLEDYLYGIGEVPSSWTMEALKAQAIAARTYGLRQTLRWGPEAALDASRKTQCWCQQYGTVVDQNYVGWSKESGVDGNRWVQAVNETAGQVVTHPTASEQTVIVAYYSSSSGGATESNVSGLGHSTPIAYLTGVSDPWSIDPLAQNPFASWTKDVSATTVASAYSLDSVTSVEVVARHPSGSAATVEIVGFVNGRRQTLTRTGRSVKATLGLRSSYFGVTAQDTFLGPFKDDDGSPHEQDIAIISEVGITKGCGPALYCPAGTVPRWQMALFLTRLHTASNFDLPSGTSQGFSDLDGASAEAIMAINQLKQLGITKGTSATTYTPHFDVPRWQMALFITRLLAADGVPLPDGSPQGFTDIGHLSAEARTSVNQLKQLGITTLNGQYQPELPMTRDLMASFMARSLEAVGAIVGF
jgi:SpoIID/LytB domain protein